MIRWKPARNAKPPSSDDLRKALADAQSHAVDLAAEAKVVEGDLANHLGTPRYAEAQSALANIETELAVARRTLDALEAGITAAEAREAEERHKSAEAEADRRHAEVRTKLVPQHEKLIREIVADQKKLAAKLAEATDLQEAIEAANECREGRAPIVDGERKLRERPERIEPAVFEDRVVWEDAAGNTPFEFRRNADGEDVPVEQGFTRKVKPVQVRSERREFAYMPPRLATEIRLVDMAGQQIWPRH